MRRPHRLVRSVADPDILVDALPLVQLSRTPFSFRESESPALGSEVFRRRAETASGQRCRSRAFLSGFSELGAVRRAFGIGHRLDPGSAAQRFTISNRVFLNPLSKPEMI